MARLAPADSRVFYSKLPSRQQLKLGKGDAMRNSGLFFPLLMAALVAPAALADGSRCHCNAVDWVGDCEARTVMSGKWIKVISSTQQCSLVDWTTDGIRRITVVTDGAETQEWLGANPSPKLQVISCKVCKDSTRADTPSAATVNPELAVAEPPTTTSGFSGNWVGYTTGPFGRKAHQGAEFQLSISADRAAGSYTNTFGAQPATATVRSAVISGNRLKLTTQFPTGEVTQWTFDLQPDNTILGKWQQQAMFRGDVYLQRR